MVRRFGALSFAFGLVSLTLACGGDEEQPTQPDEPNPHVTTIEVTPSSAELNALGTTQSFKATAKDQNGNTMPGVNFSWSVSPDSVGSVDNQGTVTAKANGSATVEAEAAGTADSARLVVDQAAAQLDITPDSVRMDSVGETIQFEAAAADRNGHRLPDPELRWSSSHSAVVRVDSTGFAQAQGEGTANVSAHTRQEAHVDTANVRVELPSGALVHSFRAFKSTHFPADLNIAVGPNRVLAVSTDPLAIFDRAGTRLDLLAPEHDLGLNELFEPILSQEFKDSDFRDSKVIFDELSGRFMITARGGAPSNRNCTSPDCTAFILLAVSRTSAPASFKEKEWHLYALDATLDNDSATGNQAVRVRLAAAKEVVTIVSTSTPIDRSDEQFYSKIRVVEKGPLLRGDSARWTDLARFRRSGSDRLDHIMQPVRNVSAAREPLLLSTAGDCQYAVWFLKTPLTDPSLSSAIANSPRYPDRRTNCRSVTSAPQPDNAPDLTIGAFKTTQPGQLPSAPVYHDGTIWAAQALDVRVNGKQVAGVRLTRIEVPDNSSHISVSYDTVIGPTAEYRFYPAVAVNNFGDLGLVYGKSSTTEYPSLYAGFWDDSIDRVDADFKIKAGTTSVISTTSGVTRWGDHFGAATDPANRSLWLIGEYAAGPQSWGAWIANLVP